MVQVNNEKAQFEALFDKLAADVLAEIESYHLPQDGIDYVKKMLYATVPGGKNNRGMTVPSALRDILKRDLTEQEWFRAATLGWCVELLQAFFLISDDIMDSSITRRGNPCWYRQEGIGMKAINDAFICEMAIYRLIKKHFRTEPYYLDILELFHEVTFQTELGQLMDLITAPEDEVDLAKFSIKKHAYIVEYKTAYYSFYLPVALAMRMGGVTSEKAYKQALDVLLPLGEYFQVQDDYLDCYGAPEVIGKIGTDIQDNKCGWLIVQAIDRASPAQRKILDECYGQKDSAKEAAVKKVYVELDLENVYRKYEEESHGRISALIEKVDESLLPREMFVTFMNRIYKRKL
ncbi:Farnesyl pyrophosphate synthetase [Rhizophlyctis rosea]|uniref:Farnesyl pyrophosphate synthetase n=1 Tax=Rhizophlyctis rosea TaxID=64517 RepID=A0AAD5SLH3_9FUNG|nr:Farnesyl pyrophosphate synthetase [Rhizophlyctis rosea]